MPLSPRIGTNNMKRVHILVAAASLGLLLGAAPVMADDCEDVVENVDDAVEIAAKVLENKMAQVTKEKAEAKDEAANAAVKSKFCSATGEFIGISRAYRVVASECLTGNKRRNTLASLDKSIKQLEDSIKPNCE